MDTLFFTDYFHRERETLANIPLVQIMRAASLIAVAKRVWIVGNGGSAATAMHFAVDLQKTCYIETIALPSLIPTITAFGNDMGWEKMYAKAMMPFAEGDTLVAISYSGASANVVEAARYAVKECGGKLIVLTGHPTEANQLARMKGTIISVDSADIKIVEDVHLSICHAISGAIHAMRSEHSELPGMRI